MMKIVVALVALMLPLSARAAEPYFYEAELEAVFSQPGFGEDAIDVRYQELEVLERGDLVVTTNGGDLDEFGEFRTLVADRDPTVVYLFYIDRLFSSVIDGYREIAGLAGEGGPVLLPTVGAKGIGPENRDGASVVAHELGHATGLRHCIEFESLCFPLPEGEENLMVASFSGKEGPDPYSPILNQAQIDRILQSPLVKTDGSGRYIEIQPILVAGESPDTDSDADGIGDLIDNCPDIPNNDQANSDFDSEGDVCDVCPADSWNDADDDGICGDVDNCEFVSNADQADIDGDGLGDLCDDCAFDASNDIDGDGVCGDVDPCLNDPLDDADGDGICDESGECALGDDTLDQDGDGIADLCDVCPADVENDSDNDCICEIDDNCSTDPNPAQADTDGDGVGDACEPDTDGDGVTDDVDNCLFDFNADQLDGDGDGIGDACDADSDADGVSDDVDACLQTFPGAAVLPNGCSVVQTCPCDNPWKNHGAYIKCVAHATNELVKADVIADEEKGAIMSEAGASSCGEKPKDE